MVLLFPSVFFLSSARLHITSPSVASRYLSGVLAFLICAFLSSSQLLHQGFLIWARKFTHKFHLPWGNIFLVLVCHLFFSCVSVDLLIFFFLIFQLCNLSLFLMIYLQKFTLRQTGTVLMLQSVVYMFVFLKSMGFSSYEGFPRQGYFSPPLTETDYFLQVWLTSMFFSSGLTFPSLNETMYKGAPTASLCTLLLLFHTRFSVFHIRVNLHLWKVYSVFSQDVCCRSSLPMYCKIISTTLGNTFTYSLRFWLFLGFVRSGVCLFFLIFLLAFEYFPGREERSAGFMALYTNPKSLQSF